MTEVARVGAEGASRGRAGDQVSCPIGEEDGKEERRGEAGRWDGASSGVQAEEN